MGGHTSILLLAYNSFEVQQRQGPMLLCVAPECIDHLRTITLRQGVQAQWTGQRGRRTVYDSYSTPATEDVNWLRGRRTVQDTYLLPADSLSQILLDHLVRKPRLPNTNPALDFLEAPIFHTRHLAP